MIRSGIALASLAWSAKRAHDGHADRSAAVGAIEERIFRQINNGDDGLHPLPWLVMQGGSLAAVGVATALSAHHGGLRHGAHVAIAGSAAWVGVKLIKPVVGRGRPDQHLDDVVIRGHPQSGLGYPSGHAAVAVALAMSAIPPGPARLLALAGAAVVGTTRIHVGAHLPLDVVGGFAAGAIVARFVRCAA